MISDISRELEELNTGENYCQRLFLRILLVDAVKRGLGMRALSEVVEHICVRGVDLYLIRMVLSHADANGYDVSDLLAQVRSSQSRLPLSADTLTPLYFSFAIRRTVSGMARTEHPGQTPPLSATYLLYFFLPRRERESVPGDLAEEYLKILTEFGNLAAKVWYWKQVLGSIGPFTWRILKKLTALALLGKAVHEFLRRLGL